MEASTSGGRLLLLLLPRQMQLPPQLRLYLLSPLVQLGVPPEEGVVLRLTDVSR